MRLYTISFLLLLLSCTTKKEETKEHETKKTGIIEQTVYVDANGHLCHAQSPINILSFNADVNGKHNITFNFKDEINAVENLGHTVQLDISEGSTITVDDEIFDFKQLHFHTLSEHLVDGVTYPMEMHMVNTLKDHDNTKDPQYLVIGVLFKMGKESTFISEFINAIPKEEHTLNELTIGDVRISDLFSEIPQGVLNSYYHYEGSLTTPPYTESVRWYVSKTVFEASPNQIKQILKIEGLNARQIQGVNNRKIESE